MLSRLQKIITIAILAGAFGWLFGFWNQSRPLAVAGFLVFACGHAVFLAMEFLLLSFINRSDPAPPATAFELLGAWAGEVVVAPQIFCWRQPFRSNAIPDHLSPGAVTHGRRGVVFIHGFFCNRGFWNPWMALLKGKGHAFSAINLEPLFGSIDDYAAQIDSAVRQVTAASGVPPLLVCHSMGGLATRAWLKAYQAEARVHHVVTIGTPHRGTWLARFGHGHNGRQMRLLSEWQTQLDDGMPAGRHALFTCWYSNTDNIVFPASTATLAGADNRLTRGAAHVQMAFLPHVISATLGRLDTTPI